MPHSVSPSSTTTVRVGTGSPASPVAAEVAPKIVKAASTAPRNSSVTTRRPRRVNRTGAATGRTATGLAARVARGRGVAR